MILRVATIVVWDMETLERVWDNNREYDGPVDLMNSKKDPYAEQASNIAKQQQDLKTQQQHFAESQENEGRANQDKAQESLSQFEGPVDQTPFYKALLTSGIQATSNRYQDAARAARSRAVQAGYGYSQPAAGVSEDQVAAQGASELADQPGKAMERAAPVTLGAASETAGIGSSQAGEGLTGSAEATGSLSGATTANQSAGTLQDMASKRKSGLFKTLAGVGLLAAAPFTGGATLAPGASVLKG